MCVWVCVGVGVCVCVCVHFDMCVCVCVSARQDVDPSRIYTHAIFSFEARVFLSYSVESVVMKQTNFILDRSSTRTSNWSWYEYLSINLVHVLVRVA